MHMPRSFHLQLASPLKMLPFPSALKAVAERVSFASAFAILTDLIVWIADSGRLKS